MRSVWLLLAAGGISASGCAGLIASSGQNLSKLTTQDEVRASFGSPVATGQVDHKPYEEFSTHRKIADTDASMRLCMVAVASCGFSECLFFPLEVFSVSRQALVGQRLRFTYDEAGNVTAITFDGKPVMLPPREVPGSAPPPVTPVSAGESR